MAGGSDTASLVQQARREERRRERKWQNRRQKSRARNIAKRRARTADDAFEPQREGFACEFLCADCGYLLGESAPRCPSCKSEDILDLGDVEVATRLRELEEARRSSRGPLVSGLVSGATGLLLAAVAGVIVHPGLGLLLALALPATLIQLLPPPYAGQLQAGLVPKRWRLPSGLHAGNANGTPVAAGHARGAELLTAPVTATSCIAWRVVVFFCGPDRQPEEVVDECRGGAVVVDNSLLSEDSYLLDRSGPLTAGDQAAAQRYLRSRGLFGADGEFRIHESILREGEWVELCGGDPPLVRRAVPAVRT